MTNDTDRQLQNSQETETLSITIPDVTQKLNARSLERSKVTIGECTGDSLERIVESAYYPR